MPKKKPPGEPTLKQVHNSLSSVSFTSGITLNLGDYNSAKFECTCSFEVPKGGVSSGVMQAMQAATHKTMIDHLCLGVPKLEEIIEVYNEE